VKLWFLPFVREGVTPVAAASTATARPQTRITMRLSAPGRQARDIGRSLELLGPGDVLGIEPGQVLRMTPAPGSRDAEPDFFPSVEFDAPELPWTYSPELPEGTRLLPWIALVVIEAQPAVRLDRGQRGQSPWILRMPADVARRELPDLSDAWAWVHVQVACATAGHIAATLANEPDCTLARLLSPRRLLPNRDYHACVVPTYLAGRLAGLGGNPAANPLVRTGREPAWSATDVPGELPVYHTWSFRTGEAGDFESLAQRLRPTPLDASIPAPPLQIATPAGLVVDWEPPLRVPGSTTQRSRRPAAAVSEIRKSLKGGTGTAPVLGPSYVGSSWMDERPLAPTAAWAPELNLTPMWRAAAGLGAEAVRGEQEALVAAASEQFEAYRRAQSEGRRKQFSTTVVNRVKARLARAPAAESVRVFAPMVALTQGASADAGLYSAAGRRVVRKTWRVRPTLADVGTIGTASVATAARATIGNIDPSLVLIAADLSPEIAYRPAVTMAPANLSALPVAPVDTAAIPQGEFAPRIARPMSEPLAERFPELMLPGFGAIPTDGVLLVESNPAFVEAFLAGANQEINAELLWRGLRADRRATAFRRFWGHASDVDDIGDIASWAPESALGSHVNQTAAMVLLVRGELVRRYPSVMVAAVPARWNADSTRSPVTDAAALQLPTFRGRIGTDVLYAGFARPTLAEAAGTPTPAGPAGWYLLLSENAGDPRFGLDPDGKGTLPTRADLSWTHLQLDANAPYAKLAAFPSVPDANFTVATATAATVSSLVRQRPFRAFLHASLLIRPKA
jgi:hypothetical protein